MNHVWIDANPRLEAIVEGKEGSPYVVFTHPHPLYGGNMNNHVVELASNIAIENGYQAIRFNFRGTGRSEGQYTGGGGEMADLDTVVRYAGDIKLLVGYSFGAWIIARYIERTPFNAILISPPSDIFEFPALKERNAWIIAGTSDQFSDPVRLSNITKEQRLTLCRSADHFWYTGTVCLQKTLSRIMAGI